MSREIVTNENREEYIEQKLSKKPYDPGVVNVPLAKRGNIDAQIDKYKKEEEKKKKTEWSSKLQAQKEESRATKAKAKEMYDKHKNHIIEVYGAKHGKAQIRKALSEMVKTDPEKFNKFFAKYNAEHKVEND